MKNISLSILFVLNIALCFGQEPERLRRSESFFGIHFDFHAGTDCNEIGKTTTPEMINTIIDKVHPDYLQIDSKGHPGYTSYPTKVGNPAPGFVGYPLRMWREITAKRGVALYLHHSGVYDIRANGLHPEWAAIKADGTTSKTATSVFGPYADRLLIPQLKEMAGEYGVDGVWLDGECWATIPDYGDRAVQLFKETTGITNIPLKADDPHFYEWMQFHREGFRNYLRHYTAALHTAYPQFQICSNWAFSDLMPEPVSVPLDYLSGDYTPNNSVNSARYSARYLAQQGLPWDLMAWSFCHNPFPVQQKTSPQLQREAAVVLALGGGFQAYFTQNRDGSVRLPELDVMADVAKFARARQAYCHHSQQIPQVALIYSTEAYLRNVELIYGGYEDNNKLRGVLQCLLESQHSVDIISEATLGTNIDRFPLVVFPEWNYISPTFRDDLLAYVKNGGNLLVIGSESSKLFASQAGVSIKEDGSSVVTKLGAGQIGFFPQNIGLAYADKGEENLRQTVNHLVKKLFPNPLVEVNGSPYVDVSVSETEGKTIVHLVNTSGNHKEAGIIEEIAPIEHLNITIRCEKKPDKITLQPEGKLCNFNYAAGKVQLTLESIAIYDILVVE
jgi:hypothetical protein